MNAPTQRETILVVDDDQDFLAQTRMQLESYGYQVTTATGLKEADEMLAEHWPDLVLADLMMEVMDAGLVLCHRVKKKSPNTPFLLVTAVTGETGMEFEATAGGWIKADAILTKPVRAEQLRREIDRVLQGKREAVQAAH